MLVALDAVTKRFPGVLALDQVSLALRAGEIHALLGENGAGKSTLISLLAGLQQPDEGRILVEGRPARLGSPRQSLACGIGTVFQHGMLVPSLTVGENLALGGPWWRPRRAGGVEARFAELCRRFGVAVELDRAAGELALGERQQVEIFRALSRGSRVLLLDEPTSMLSPAGIEQLGRLLRQLAAEGLGILFITHKLAEAATLAHRITVLRLGRKVREVAPGESGARGNGAGTLELLRDMFGAASVVGRPTRPRPRQVPILRAHGLAVGDGSDVAVGGIDFDLHQGEILGIAGIDGNGQKELAETLAGQRRLRRGELRLADRPIGALGVAARRHLGLRYVTDDRLGEGTVGGFSIAINLLLKEIGRPPFWRRGIEQTERITRHAQALMAAFDVRAPGPRTPVAHLSGGNVQKVVLARELAKGARVVVYNKPTYGLDAGSTIAVRRRLGDAVEAGGAAVLISTDLDEILELSTHVAVMSGGRLSTTFANDGSARHRAAELMAGIVGA